MYPETLQTNYTIGKKLTSDREILQTVSGLQVEFLDSNEPLPNANPTRVSGPQSDVIASEIAKLLKKGVIEEAQHSQGEVVSPIFLHRKADGGSRLILNLKKFNTNVKKAHFKMETIVSILKLIQKDAFMVKLRHKRRILLRSNYKDHQKIFRFKFQGKLYQYTVLPNGYSPGNSLSC